MKLLLLTELYSPSIGGLETRFRAWAEELVRQGHSVELWCIDHLGTLPLSEVLAGVRVCRLASSDHYKAGGTARRHWPTVFRYCLALWKKRKRMREFDAILLGKWPLLHAALMPLSPSVPTFFDWCELRTGPIWPWIYRAVLRRRLRHITIHEGIAQWLMDRGIAPRDITVIGSSGGQPALAELPARCNRSIVFVGRLSEHKQPRLLLEAFAQARLGERGYVLNIAGAGPEADAIAARAATVPGVIIHGPVSEKRKFELLAEASLMALPSVREGFPIVMAEACTVGTPTLTINAPDNGTAFVIRQLGIGWVCEPTLPALAKALEQHADQEIEDWQDRSRVAHQRSIDTLSIEAQARQLLIAAMAAKDPQARSAA